MEGIIRYTIAFFFKLLPTKKFLKSNFVLNLPGLGKVEKLESTSVTEQC